MNTALLEKLARPELLAMQGYSSARMEAGAAPVILNANENPWPPACDCDPGWHINRYPDPQPESVVRRLAEIYAVEPDRVLVTRGSDEGIDLLVRAFCRAGRDAMVYCPPAFGMYAVAAGIQNAEAISIPLLPDKNWRLDIDAICNTPAKLVFICSPNNPTGHLASEDDISELCRRLAQQSLVIVDEAYIEFSDAPSMATQLNAHPNLLVLRTLSKAWGMAGLRCGAVLADPGIIQLLRKIMAPYPLPVTTQRLVEQALSESNRQTMQQRAQRLRSERQRMATELTDCTVVEFIWPSDANFLLLRVNNAEQLVAAAAAAGILIRNQSYQPGLNNCVRITIGKPAENDALLHFMQTAGEQA